MTVRITSDQDIGAPIEGPVANFFRPAGALRADAAHPNFCLHDWLLRQSKPYLWLSRCRSVEHSSLENQAGKDFVTGPIVVAVSSREKSV